MKRTMIGLMVLAMCSLTYAGGDILHSGDTNPKIYFMVTDSTDQPVTGLAYDAFTTYYVQEAESDSTTETDGNLIAITEATGDDPNEAWGSGKIIEVGVGLYRFDVPAASVAGASGTAVVYIIQYAAATPDTWIRAKYILDPPVNVVLSNGTTVPIVNVSGGIVEANVKKVNDDATADDNLALAYNGTGYAGGTIVTQADLTSIHGTALTETAGQLAAAFVKFFNVATPTGTVDSIPDAVAGAAGGLFIAGTNAATTITSGTATQAALTLTGNTTGAGLKATGGVTGNGIEAFGGATSGNGIVANAPTDGIGFWAYSSTLGGGMQVSGAGGYSGLILSGNGAGAGIISSGGTTGHGLEVIGGETSGNGLYAHATSGAGLYAVGGTAGSGIKAEGGTDGNGMECEGGATSGTGLYAHGGGDGIGLAAIGAGLTGYGLFAQGNGANAGLYGQGGATGPGILGIGGGNNALASGMELTRGGALADDLKLTYDDSVLNVELAKVPKSDSTVSWNSTALGAVATTMMAKALTVPTAGASPDTPTLDQALSWLYSRWFNKSITTSSEYQLYMRNETDKMYEQDVSDDGTALTVAEAKAAD